MSDEPEFEEVQITAADARRAKMASALMLGAVLPGMADVLPEASHGPDARPAAEQLASAGAAAPVLRHVAIGGTVIAMVDGVPEEYARMASLFRTAGAA
ncbi:MAG: hypothetical protein CMH12_16340 [Maritimibacter sp.]|nr:hypothetical protein [Maritimibacter sp.]